MADDFAMFDPATSDHSDHEVDADAAIPDTPIEVEMPADVPDDMEQTSFDEVEIEQSDYPEAPVAAFETDEDNEQSNYYEPPVDVDEVDEPSDSPFIEEQLDMSAMGMGGEDQDIAAMISPLSMWEIEHEKMLAEKRAASADKHAEHLMETKADLDRFYEERTQRIHNTAERNRDAQGDFVSDRDSELEEGKEWEQVVKYVQLDGKVVQTQTKDVTRFKQILFQLKAAQSQ